MNYVVAIGESAKKAYLNALEQEEAWVLNDENYYSDILDTKRYFIVNIQPFPSKEEALLWLESFDFSTIKYRKNTCGTCILSDNQYLFFKLP